MYYFKINVRCPASPDMLFMVEANPDRHGSAFCIILTVFFLADEMWYLCL